MTLLTPLVLIVWIQSPAMPSRHDGRAPQVSRAHIAEIRESLDELLIRVDESVRSERLGPERRRVQFDRSALERGLRLGARVAEETGNRSYERRFRAREKRLAGTALLNEGHFAEAMTPLSAALAEAQALGDTWLETIARVNLAYAHLELGRPESALRECERAFERARGLDDKARALTFLDLASVHLHLGNLPQAIAFSNQTIALSRKIGIRTWEGNSFLNLGVAHERLGDLRASQQAFEQARAILERTNDRPSLGRALYNLGQVTSRQHQYAEAADYLERALPIIRAVDIRHSHDLDRKPMMYQNPIELSAIRALVEACIEIGDIARAAAHVTRLRQIEALPQADEKPR